MSDEAVLRAARRELADAGLRVGLLIRDLDSGEELGLDADLTLPIASLVKIPIALAVTERLTDGRLDGGQTIDVDPGRAIAPGPAGISRFRHPARIAVDDLLYLAVAVSDNSAADALLDLVPVEEVRRCLTDAGLRGIEVRHGLRDLGATPVEAFDASDRHLAHALAIGARSARRGHPVPQLDLARANAGSATAFVDLLAELWSPRSVDTIAAQRVRELLGAALMRHRLAPELASDSATWSSKTGTLLNLRHEVGVVEHDDGRRIAIAALTESSVPAVVQPAAEAVLASVVRTLHDHLLEA